jgi:tetratricopeptide (TPR) repeat protein
MSDVIIVDRPTAHDRSSAGWRRYLTSGVVLVLALGVILTLAFWFHPSLLAAYNVERAGRLMDAGLAWPEPRVLESVPVSRNDQALDQALGHLAAALRWQPDSVHAYRLASQIYAARQAWMQAAEALEQAQVLEPKNTLVAWERALAYEQIWRQLRADPGLSLVSGLEQAEVLAPSTPIDTPFCRQGPPERCYVARTSFSQPMAVMPEGPGLAADVIFLHPPAELRLVQSIPQDQTTLFFLMGLDPHARDWGSDGAGFQVLVQASDGAPQPIFEAILDADTVRRGWSTATADLTPWAGKTITLILRTTAGNAHNSTADWYGWGNVTLLSAGQAQRALLAPDARLRQAWEMSKIDVPQYLTRAEARWNEDEIEAARRWYE